MLNSGMLNVECGRWQCGNISYIAPDSLLHLNFIVSEQHTKGSDISTKREKVLFLASLLYFTNISVNQTLSTDVKTSKLTDLYINSSDKEAPSPARKSPLLFYMYELEEKFWWRWPIPGADCSENGYVGHDHAELSGIGPAILPDDGLFLTWHFSLFSSLFNRLKRSSRRTFDPDKASLFVIPYDLGLDGYLDASSCRNRRHCTRGLVGKLQSYLSASKYFTRHNGADHAVLWSLGQYHPWPGAGCDIFMKEYCSLCTFTCYWMDPTKKDNRFVSIPFPSGYHWWDGMKNIPWDVSRSNHRNLTAVYLGSTQTLNPYHTKIRRAMTAQCNTSSECHWLQIAHSSKDSSIADFLSIYKRSIFCLCPPGDDPARKAVFDAIVSGCIPVIFEVATLYNQYPWHIGEQTALDISVSIPGGLVKSGKLNFMSILLGITPDVIKKKQLALAALAPRVQYSVPPIEYLRNRSDSTKWDPPFKDGVEILLDGLFERTNNIINNKSTGIPHRFMTGREWSKEYEIVRIQVPFSNVSIDNQNLIPGTIKETSRTRGVITDKRSHSGTKSRGHGTATNKKGNVPSMMGPGEEENQQV
eukprot:gene10631-14276_t